MAEAMLPSEGAGAVSLATLQGSIYTARSLSLYKLFVSSSSIEPHTASRHPSDVVHWESCVVS